MLMLLKFQTVLRGDVFVYAGHGNILFKNNINIKKVSGYKVTTYNSSKIVYSSGLANLLFSAGPSGSFEINGWREVK